MVASTPEAWPTTRGTSSCSSRQCASSPQRASVQSTFASASSGWAGEGGVGGDSIVQWVEQDELGADAALILDGSMARRGQPVFYMGVRGMLYFHLRLRTGTTDMHSGMFGAAALNAT